MRRFLALLSLLALALAPLSPAAAAPATPQCASGSHAAHHQMPGHDPSAKAGCCAGLVQALAPRAAMLVPLSPAPIVAIAEPIRAFTGIDPSSEDPPPRIA